MSPLAKIRSCSGVRPSERRQGVGTCALALQSGVGLTRVLDPTAWKNALEESNRGPAWVPHVWLQAAEEPGDGQQGVHGPRATTPEGAVGISSPRRRGPSLCPRDHHSDRPSGD